MFIDGFRVAEELRIQDPEAFRMLTSTSHPFEYRDPDEGVLLRAAAPVIQLDQANALQRITFNNRSAAALPASFPNLEDHGSILSHLKLRTSQLVEGLITISQKMAQFEYRRFG